MEATGQKLQTVCVFGGPGLGKDEEYMRITNILGNLLAVKNIKLVYGGGNMGLMGCIANNVSSNNGKVVGIVSKPLIDNNPEGPVFGDEFKVPSMHERIATMLYNADAFIALPGGLGTLEQILTVVSWANLNLHDKPIALLNIKGFYDGLIRFLDSCIEQEFIKAVDRPILFVASYVEEIIDQLEIRVRKSALSFLQNKKEDEGGSSSSSSSKKRKLDTTLRL